MEGLPQDVFQFDQQTFPQEDPKIREAREKSQQKEKQIRAQEEAAQKKAEREEAIQVKKVLAQHGGVVKKPAETPVPVHKRELMVQKIKLYYEKLGHKLSSKCPKIMPKSDEGVRDLLAEIEGELQSAGGIEKASSGYIALCAGIEMADAKLELGLNLAGPAASFSQTVAASQSKWQDLMTEFAISNAEWFMVGPGKRLIMETVQIMMAVSQANAGAGKMRVPQQPSEDLKGKAEDL